MTALSYHHLYATYPVCTDDWWATPSVCTPLSPKAVLQQLDFNGDGTGDGLGIVLIVNGEPFYMRMNALPAAGTQWRFTAYGGGSMTATCTPAIPASGDIAKASAPTTCNVTAYTPPETRPAFAGQWRLRVTNARQFDVADAGSLDSIHTVPDPYYVTNALEITANTKVLRFVNMPHQAIIRIYSTSGILVNILSHNDAAGGGEVTWNLRNRNNQFIASGVYFYHVETADGREKIGRFTVVNYAQ
ncbi:MAG: hypothetical protein A2085_07160 [Gemmatimonadetes bacterium GWC2_71_10]|nr:MAG: hypothetical protein A2085_07160 [Gemmatimonadetes bacterium GWC2_71_10]